MKRTPTRKRLLLSLGAAAVAAAVIAFAVAVAPRPSDQAAEVNPLVFSLPPTVPALASAESDTVVVAPYSPEWWTKIASMAPAQMGLLKVDLASAGTPVLRLGYSRGPDSTTYEIPNTGPLRLAYLETGSAEDAKALAVWLKNQPMFDNRRVHIQDRTVIVGQSWNATFTVPGKAMDSVPFYEAGEGATQASMWVNIDQEIVSLTGSRDEKTREVYGAVMTKAVGFKPGTTWIGRSGDGRAWTGDFRSGGIDPDQIDFPEAQEVLSSAETVLLEAKDGMTTTRFVEPGASGIMTGATIVSGKSRMGGLSLPAAVPSVDNQVVLLAHDVTRWTSALVGNYSGAEAIGLRTMSANEKSMVIGLNFQDPSQVGPVPGRPAANGTP